MMAILTWVVLKIQYISRIQIRKGFTWNFRLSQQQDSFCDGFNNGIDIVIFLPRNECGRFRITSKPSTCEFTPKSCTGMLPLKVEAGPVPSPQRVGSKRVLLSTISHCYVVAKFVSVIELHGRAIVLCRVKNVPRSGGYKIDIRVRRTIGFT